MKYQLLVVFLLGLSLVPAGSWLAPPTSPGRGPSLSI